MNDLKVKLVLEAMDRITRPLRGMTSRVRQMATQMSAAFRSVGQSMRNVGQSMNQIGQNLTAKFTTMIAGMGFASLKTAGNIEEMKIKFESLLQSANKANTMVDKLVNFTAATPFQLEGVGTAATQLLTAGVATENMIDRLNVLADIAALAGADMGEMGKIYSRVRSQQVAYTMELEMLNDRGVPIWQELAKITGKSIQKIRKETGNGLVTFELFERALESMREQGGVAYQQAEKQALGWNGLLSTLVDNIKLNLAAIGDSMIKNLDLKQWIGDLIVKIQKLRFWFENLTPATQSLIFKFAIIAALLGPLILVIGQLSMGLGSLFIGFSLMAKSIAILSRVIFLQFIPALFKMSVALLTTPIGWIILGITAVAVAAFLIIKHWDKIKAFWSKLWGGIKSELQAASTFISSVILNILGGAADLFMTSWESVRDFWDGLWDGIVEKVRDAAALIRPIIETVSSAVRTVTDNPLTRGIGGAINLMTGDSNNADPDVQTNRNRVDTGGELRITIDEKRGATATAKMNDKNTSTTIDQGVLMGAAL